MIGIFFIRSHSYNTTMQESQRKLTWHWTCTSSHALLDICSSMLWIHW